MESKRRALKFNQLSPDEDLSFSHIPVQISVCRDQQKCVFLITLVYQRKSDPVAAPQAESLITDHAGLSSSLVGRPACILRGETQGRNLSEEQTAARLDDVS